MYYNEQTGEQSYHPFYESEEQATMIRERNRKYAAGERRKSVVLRQIEAMHANKQETA